MNPDNINLSVGGDYGSPINLNVNESPKKIELDVNTYGQEIRVCVRHEEPRLETYTKLLVELNKMTLSDDEEAKSLLLGSLNQIETLKTKILNKIDNEIGY